MRFHGPWRHALELEIMKDSRIASRELNALVGTSKCPVILDVRREAVFDSANTRIASARWHEASSIEAAAHLINPEQGAIVYCAHGHNMSALAAARLRALGVAVRVLEGGIAAFAESGGLLVKKADDLPSGSNGKPTNWMTRERPKIDRIACPWLIRRFIDPFAVFHFVEAPWVKEVADEMGGIAYDIDGVFWSHRGETCAFDTMIFEYGLASPALEIVAQIIRGADTARLDLAPQAAGLLAISLGLSRLFDDDFEQLDAGMLIYDALYAWARDGQGETHNWPSMTPG
jgi:rhodanese-related sulfurtransferase